MPLWTEQEMLTAEVEALQRSGVLRHLDVHPLQFAQEVLGPLQVEILDTDSPEVTYLDAFDVDSSDGPGATVAEVIHIRRYGQAAIIRNFSDDIPKVGVKGEKQSSPYEVIGVGYALSTEDLESYAQQFKLGLQLDFSGTLADTAKMAADQKANDITYVGDINYPSMPSLLNNPYINSLYLPADGEGGSTTLRSKASDGFKILRDLNTIANVSNNITKRERSRNMLIATSLYNFLAAVPLTTFGKETVLTAFLENQKSIRGGGVTEIIPVYNLEGAAPDGSDVICAYEKNKKKIKVKIARPYQLMPAQFRNMEINYPGNMKFGGLFITRPSSVTVAFGV